MAPDESYVVPYHGPEGPYPSVMDQWRAPEQGSASISFHRATEENPGDGLQKRHSGTVEMYGRLQSGRVAQPPPGSV